MAIGQSIHIGLNYVDREKYNDWDGQLNGCVNDATGLTDIADTLGYSSTLITNSEATSYTVLGAIVSASRNLQAGDILWLTYSGHGGQVKDTGNDEADAKDETWVLYDRQVVDDELFALWSQFEPGVRIVVLSDSCHSGSIIKGAMTQDIPEARSQRRTRTEPDEVKGYRGAADSTTDRGQQWEDTPKAMPRRVADHVGERDRELYDMLQWVAGPSRSADVRASVLQISGCQDNQYSYDGAYYGQFTGILLDVWDGGAFEGDYQSFHRAILARMPPEQSPNYLTAGVQDAAFEQQKPFTLDAPWGLPDDEAALPDTTASDSTTPDSETTLQDWPELRLSSQGDDVVHLQQLLQQHGYNLSANGFFGRLTESYVRDFQRSQGLPANGVVDPETWELLELL